MRSYIVGIICAQLQIWYVYTLYKHLCILVGDWNFLLDGEARTPVAAPSRSGLAEVIVFYDSSKFLYANESSLDSCAYFVFSIF